MCAQVWPEARVGVGRINGETGWGLGDFFLTSLAPTVTGFDKRNNKEINYTKFSGSEFWL